MQKRAKRVPRRCLGLNRFSGGKNGSKFTHELVWVQTIHGSKYASARAVSRWCAGRAADMFSHKPRVSQGWRAEVLSTNFGDLATSIQMVSHVDEWIWLSLIMQMLNVKRCYVPIRSRKIIGSDMGVGTSGIVGWPGKLWCRFDGNLTLRLTDRNQFCASVLCFDLFFSFMLKDLVGIIIFIMGVVLWNWLWVPN